MKLNFKGILVLLLLVAMVPASATIARLKALGMNETDNEGSYYIQDDRNIFLNVANINKYKDSMILEWGGSGTNFGSASLTTDEDAGPKAKGGFLKSHGDYVYGVYLGNESNTAALLRGVGTGAYAADNALPAGAGGSAGDSMLDGADNQLDLFFGGSSSMGDWGVNLVYTEDKNAANNAYNIAHALRAGLTNDNWGAFVNLSTGSKSKQIDTIAAAPGGTVSHAFDGKFGVHLGGHYNLKKGDTSSTVYGFVKKFDWEQFDSAGSTSGLTANVPTSPTLGGLSGLARNSRGQAGTIDGGFMTYAVGWGSQMKSGKGTLFTNVEYRSKEIEAKFTAKAEGKRVEVPITVGYEYMATSWMTLRGSVRQNIYGYRENNNYTSLNLFGNVAAISQFGADTNGAKVTDLNTTNINAGASFDLGKVRIDGFIGTTSGTRNATTGAENGTLALDNLLTRVGMVYSF
ncbi:MAG: hypothetical protein NXH75_09880 [Halobacteriovoraceae bacterium]|nr:hypothetical protein [Halobacteriovoraceae bacterium]